MISKELLSEIYNIENSRISMKVDSFSVINENTIAIHFYMIDGHKHINIHELAFMCKEFIGNNEFSIILTMHSNTSFSYQLENHKESGICYENSAGDTTFLEVMIELAEWVYKNKEIK